MQRCAGRLAWPSAGVQRSARCVGHFIAPASSLSHFVTSSLANCLLHTEACHSRLCVCMPSMLTFPPAPLLACSPSCLLISCPLVLPQGEPANSWLWVHMGVQLTGWAVAVAGVVLVLVYFPFNSHYKE